MTPYDAVFLAVAVAVLSGPVRRRWAAALAPALAWVCMGLPQAGLGIPVTAMVILLLAPRAAPVALILAVPEYDGAGDVLRATLLWPAATILIEALDDRLPAGDELPARLQGAPLRLAACSILYWALQPLAYAFR